MSNISKNSQISKLTSFIQENMGKEVDVARFYDNLDVTGLRLVGTAKSVRFLCRLTFQGKKLSRTLGSFSHDGFETEIPSLVAEVKYSTNVFLMDCIHLMIRKKRQKASLLVSSSKKYIFQMLR